MNIHHLNNSTAQNVLKSLFMALMVMLSIQVCAAEKPAQGEGQHDHSTNEHNHKKEDGDKQKPSEDKHDHKEGEEKHIHSKDKDEHNHGTGKHDDHEDGSHTDTTPSRVKGK